MDDHSQRKFYTMSNIGSTLVVLFFFIWFIGIFCIIVSFFFDKEYYHNNQSVIVPKQNIRINIKDFDNEDTDDIIVENSSISSI